MGRKQKGPKEDGDEGGGCGGGGCGGPGGPGGPGGGAGGGGMQDIQSTFSRLQQMMAMTNPTMFGGVPPNPMAMMANPLGNLPLAQQMAALPAAAAPKAQSDGGGSMGEPGGAKKEWVIKPGLKPGDWTCPRCDANVYASKFNCWRCGVSKRGDMEAGYISEHGRIHPDIRELCDAFYVEERHVEKLNELMKARTDTWDEDLKKLREVMEKARSPCGMLVTKMKEIEDGTFVAINRDKRMKYLVEKFKLDKTAETSISDILARCSKEKQEEYYYDLERHFECSGKPSATAMMIMKKMANGEPLGPPGRPGKGSYLERLQNEKEGGGKDRPGGGDRGGGDRGGGGGGGGRGGDRGGDRRDRERSPRRDDRRGGDDRDRRGGYDRGRDDRGGYRDDRGRDDRGRGRDDRGDRGDRGRDDRGGGGGREGGRDGGRDAGRRDRRDSRDRGGGDRKGGGKGRDTRPEPPKEFIPQPKGMEAPEHGEGCPEAVGLHGKAAAEALQSGAERVRRELQANLQAMIRKAISEGRPMEEWTA